MVVGLLGSSVTAAFPPSPAQPADSSDVALQGERGQARHREQARRAAFTTAASAIFWLTPAARPVERVRMLGSSSASPGSHRRRPKVSYRLGAPPASAVGTGGGMHTALSPEYVAASLRQSAPVASAIYLSAVPRPIIPVNARETIDSPRFAGGFYVRQGIRLVPRWGGGVFCVHGIVDDHGGRRLDSSPVRCRSLSRRSGSALWSRASSMMPLMARRGCRVFIEDRGAAALSGVQLR